MAPSIPGVNWDLLTAKLIYWMGWGLLIVVFLAAFWFVFYYTSFRYKVTILEKRGSGKIGKIKTDRARPIKDNGVEKWKLFKARDKIPPVDFDSIYAGEKVFLYKSGPSAYFPVQFNVNEQSPTFNPIEKSLSFWMGLEFKQAAEDYQKPGFWEKHGALIGLGGTVLFCCILVGVTVYYTYQHANGVVGGLQSVTAALRDVSTIGGIGPQ